MVMANPERHPVVVLSDPMEAKICASDIDSNKQLIVAVLKNFPDKVPSGYLLAEAIKLWDDRCDRQLLFVDKAKDATIQQGVASVKERSKLKRLVQYLRDLARRRPHAGKHADLMPLQDLR